MASKGYLKIWRKHAILREGKRLKVYKDSLGKLTVGIGHLVTDDDKLRLGSAITEAQCEAFFLADTAKAEKAALAQAKASGVETDEWIAALISVNFQLGTNWTEDFFSTWPRIVKGNYDEAINLLRKSKWYRQTPVRVEDFIKAIEGIKAHKAKKALDKARPLKKTRTVKGATVIGGSATATLGFEAIQQIAPAFPLLEKIATTAPYILLVVIILGAAYVIYARNDDRKRGLR